MNYESVSVVESRLATGVSYTVSRMSFGRRTELMRRIRELAGRMEFLEAGQEPGDKMDAALLQSEVNRLYVAWGLRAVAGLQVDGLEAIVVNRRHIELLMIRRQAHACWGASDQRNAVEDLEARLIND